MAIDYASVSHATGLMIAGRYQRRPPFPFAPGTEAVGRIVAVGPEQARLRVGQRVALVADWGCFAEQVRMRDDTVYPIPDGVHTLDALPLPISYGTAYTGLFWRARMQRGDIVLVLGAGAGVGLAALELAVQAGERVIACASTEAKRQAARDRGAWHAIDGQDLAATVKRLTDDHGADIVFDPVGGELFDAGVRAAAQNGQLLSIGFASGTIPKAPLNYLLVKNLTLHGFFYGRYIGWTPADERAAFAEPLQAAMASMMEGVRRGGLRPTVAHTYEIDQLADALHALESRQVVGKVALRIGGQDRRA